MANGMIGLEIHVYLTTKEKLFCRCTASREKGTTPNTFICPVCTGQPGAKPMLPNQDAVEKAVQIGLLLDCTINPAVSWQRKHYDWPDLPKGYQTTISGTHALPLGVKGTFSGIRINSMHLEEDPASWNPKTGCVDYNRSGLPLVEIVTEPDFTYAEEVAEWLKKLVHALSYLKAVDKDAGIKADVNVNIPGKTERVEVKNINSIDNIIATIDYELDRQQEEGSVRETRRFDEAKGITMSMRKKEGADDYRFISDPDLIPLVLDTTFVTKLKKQLPELPEKKLARLIRKYSIDTKNAAVLTKYLDVADFFEHVATKIDGSFALNWVTVELLRVLNWNKKELSEVHIEVDHFVKLLELVKNKKITELQAKQTLNKFIPKSFDPTKTVQEKISDETELTAIITKVISAEQKAVADYKNGDVKALNFLMGQIMKETNRRADFVIARKLLEKILA